MDVFQAMKDRRSCRSFSQDPVDDEAINTILEAATWAPSPMNAQPWEFIVVRKPDVKEKIFSEADRCRQWALETSGWKWLGKYSVDFLKAAPVVIAVVGDPEKTGMDKFQEDGGVGYQHACAAAIQNMHLAAHALGLSTLWFTLFDKKALAEILGVDAGRTPLALVCVGKAGGEIPPVPRKDWKNKTRTID
jgi:nitroreductase